MERNWLNNSSYGSLFFLNILEVEKLVKQVGVFFFSIVLKLLIIITSTTED